MYYMNTITLFSGAGEDLKEYISPLKMVVCEERD